MTDWNNKSPALGEVITKLMNLNARLLRLEAARRLNTLIKIKQLTEKTRG